MNHQFAHCSFRLECNVLTYASCLVMHVFLHKRHRLSFTASNGLIHPPSPCNYSTGHCCKFSVNLPGKIRVTKNMYVSMISWWYMLVPCGSVGRAWRWQFQGCGFDCGEQYGTKTMKMYSLTKLLWRRASAKRIKCKCKIMHYHAVIIHYRLVIMRCQTWHRHV